MIGHSMLNYEQEAAAEGFTSVAGCDEAGRGCLAGPVVAAAVIIPNDAVELFIGITDSKQLSEKKRLDFFAIITEHAIVGLGMLEAEVIDRVNIYEASRMAMLMALSNIDYDFVLTDAMPIKTLDVPVIPIIKGDQLSLSIAAASIVAKTVRDSIMKAYGKKYPQYGFENHKGYGTKKHLEALVNQGVIDGLYRKTFSPVSKLLESQGTLF
ncbi:MAG: ribonuclease HII [Culicoidibacterales bacterium]